MTSAPVPLDVALYDSNLLGAGLGDTSSWRAWIAVLKAAHGRRLDEHDRKLFAELAGGREPPTRKVKELVVVASRRSGKGRIGSALAVHAALLTDHSAMLSPGEVGVVAAVSPTRAQAAILLNYCLGYLEASPLLRGELRDVTQDELRLANGNVITTLTSDYRSLRGRTLLLAVLDEAAFLRDELSASPDVECARALLPGLATTAGMLCILSSPYRRAGLVHQRHRDFYGRNSADVLVIQAPSVLLNPTLDASVIASAQAADAFAAQSEWLGLFRDDISQFLSEDLIELAVDRLRPPELRPQQGVRYKCFVDASGGRHDHYTVAIGHKDAAGRFVCDTVKGFSPPFDPALATEAIAVLAKEYGCEVVVGDNYSADWITTVFKDCGLKYERAEKNRSELYLEGLPWFSRGLVLLPEHQRLERELRLLERHTSRSGKDRVDHGRVGSDDYSNVVFGALHLAMSAVGRYRSDMNWVHGDDEATQDANAQFTDYGLARERAYHELALALHGQVMAYPWRR